jgi:hypothetical protein
MENLPGIAETLRTVALFQGNATPAISPITLRPRKNLSMPEKFSGPDPRQKGLFCAAWTLGNLMHCLDSGAYCLTYFETTGESGLMPSNEESVYAVYHLIATVNEMTGGNVKICSCNDQSRIASIVFEKGLTLLMLVANLSDSPQQVTIFDLPASINFSILDETTFEEATSFPQLWRIKKGRNRYATGPFHIFDILPYGILRIEADLAK